MTRKTTFLLAFALFLGPAKSDLVAQPPGDGQPSPKKAVTTRYVRLLRDDDKEPMALQTATVRFTSPTGKAGATVDLVGVVHIGDREYYRKLNKQLEQYDAVLFELVAPPNTVIPKTVIPKGGKRDSSHPLALVQTAMKAVLGLEAQTERIDYTRKNFIHADLSPEQMAKAIRNRGDTGVTLALSIAAALLRQQNLEEMKKRDAKAEPEIDLLSALLDPEGAVKLKRLLAEQLAGAAADSGLGPTLNTILISDRNAGAMGALQKELAKGTKKIAIFYGAAHMPDFERRLRDDFGLWPQSPHWVDAWDLRVRPRGGLEELLKQFLP